MMTISSEACLHVSCIDKQNRNASLCRCYSFKGQMSRARERAKSNYSTNCQHCQSAGEERFPSCHFARWTVVVLVVVFWSPIPAHTAALLYPFSSLTCLTRSREDWSIRIHLLPKVPNEIQSAFPRHIFRIWQTANSYAHFLDPWSSEEQH